MYWIVWTLHRVWRIVLWREGGEALTALSARLEGPIVPSRAGWEIEGTHGRLRIRGGIRGTRTEVWRPDGTRRVDAGWLDVAEVDAWLADQSPSET